MNGTWLAEPALGGDDSKATLQVLHFSNIVQQSFPVKLFFTPPECRCVSTASVLKSQGISARSIFLENRK